MSQLERGQPMVPIARNIPARVPTSATQVALQPQPVIATPLVMSEGQRLMENLFRAVGMTAGVVGAAGQIAAQRRAMTKADQREMDIYDTGQAARNRQFDFVQLADEIANDSANWELDEGETYEQRINEWVQFHTKDTSDAYTAEYGRLGPQVLDLLNKRELVRQKREQGRLDRQASDGMRTSGNAAAIYADAVTIKETRGYTNDQVMTKLILPAMVGADQEQFDALKKVANLLVGESGFKDARDRIQDALNAERIRAERQQIQDAVNAVRDQPEGEAQLAELERRKDTLPPRMYRAEQGRIHKDHLDRYVQEQIRHILDGTKSEADLRADWKTHGELPEDELGHLPQNIREQLGHRFKAKQELDLKTAQVLSKISGNVTVSVPKEVYGTVADDVLRTLTYRTPEGEALAINTANQIDSPAAAVVLSQAIINLGYVPDDFKATLYDLIESPDSKVADNAINLLSQVMTDQPAIFASMLKGAKGNMELAIGEIFAGTFENDPPAVKRTKVRQLLREPPIPAEDAEALADLKRKDIDLEVVRNNVIEAVRQLSAPTGFWRFDPDQDPLHAEVADSLDAWFSAAYQRHIRSTSHERAVERATLETHTMFRANYDIVEFKDAVFVRPIKGPGFVADRLRRWNPEMEGWIKADAVKELGQEVWDEVDGIDYDIGETAVDPVTGDLLPQGKWILTIGSAPVMKDDQMWRWWPEDDQLQRSDYYQNRFDHYTKQLKGHKEEIAERQRIEVEFKRDMFLRSQLAR